MTDKTLDPASGLSVIRERSALHAQYRRLRPLLLFVLMLGMAAGLAVVMLSRHSGLPLHFMIEEPAGLYQTPFYIGLLSSLEALLWISTAACCLFAANLLRNVPRRTETVFLCWSGLLSLFLTLDGVLMIHDRILPHHLHISERVSYPAYALLVAWYLLRFLPVILTTDHLLLLVALVFLCTAALAKAFLSDRGPGLFFQDGFKFVGVIFWLVYYAHVATAMMRTALPRKRASAGSPGE